MSLDFSYKTLREEVVIILRKRILSGKYKPGEKIKESRIAKELNISRGPVREALREIEQEGLVSYSRNRGCTVRTISPREMSEIYLLRSTLEILAVRLYSGKLKDSTIAKLEECANNMETMSEENNLYGIVKNDEEFHSLIVREAGVKLLFETWKNFEGGNAAVYYTMRSSNIMPRSIKNNHFIIIDAFKEKNLDKICHVIQEHYMVVPENLYDNQNKKHKGKKFKI